MLTSPPDCMLSATCMLTTPLDCMLSATCMLTTPLDCMLSATCMLTSPLDCMQVCLTGFGAHVGQLLPLWIPTWTVWTGRLLLPTEELLSHGLELVRL